MGTILLSRPSDSRVDNVGVLCSACTVIHSGSIPRNACVACET